MLIQGGTGTGKGLVAKAVHTASCRTTFPFVQFNCGCFPDSLLETELFGHVKGAFTGATRDRPGRFEEAHRGTLFLDEIGEMSLSSQVRLLRILDDHCVERLGSNKARHLDVRIVCATNRNLPAMVADRSFRSDLYYRLKVVEIMIPPLRDRPEDIPPLAEHFLRLSRQCCGQNIEGITPQAINRLMSHPWPGNVRELKHAIEAACLRCNNSMIGLEDLPGLDTGAWPRCGERRRSERRQQPHRLRTPEPFCDASTDDIGSTQDESILLHLLQQNHWHIGKTAEMLGVHRTTLWRRLQRFNFES